ncbi:MAG: hypothetical protein M1377_02070 [Deltaproteobacteria bacterium]|nr:hypothetical protein [Deltaproteobacteria bacterium]
MIPERQRGLHWAAIGALLVSLPVAPACCKRWCGAGQEPAKTENAAGTVGVTVTKDLPHTKETLPEIRDREKTNPLPPRGDIAVHSHKILRAVSDNGIAPPPGSDNTGK